MLIENLIHCITEPQESMRYTAWDVINTKAPYEQY